MNSLNVYTSKYNVKKTLQEHLFLFHCGDESFATDIMKHSTVHSYQNENKPHETVAQNHFQRKRKPARLKFACRRFTVINEINSADRIRARPCLSSFVVVVVVENKSILWKNGRLSPVKNWYGNKFEAHCLSSFIYTSPVLDGRTYSIY